MAAQSGDRRALAAALAARRLVRAGPDGLADRMQLAQQMLMLSRQSDDAPTEMWARLWQIDASFEVGDLARVAAEIDALALCAQRVRGPMARFEVLRCRAVLAQAQGRFEDARRFESDAFNALVPTGNLVRFVVRSALRGMIGHHVGQDAASLAANTFDGAPEGTQNMVGLIAQLASAHTLASAGRLPEAADTYRSTGPVSDWQPPPHVVLFSYAFGVAVALALDLSTDAATLRELLAPHRGHHVVSGTSAVSYFGPVELWLGVAALQLGRLDDAIADLEQADQACADSGAHGFRVEAQYRLASALARRAERGDVERARSLLVGAGASAVSLGMMPFVLKVRELSSQLDRASGATALTRREREVAELVAEGLTNREIAERLFVSERTAENHVQHILTKLGLSNRSRLAVWVASRK